MQQPQPYFRSLQILYFALLAGQVIFLTIFGFSGKSTRRQTISRKTFWLQAIAVFSLATVGMGMFLGRKFIDNARNQTGVSQKLAAYRSARILGWALAEGATLVNGIFFFLSGRLEFIYLAICALGFFITLMPKREKIATDLELNSSERAELDNQL